MFELNLSNSARVRAIRVCVKSGKPPELYSRSLKQRISSPSAEKLDVRDRPHINYAR